MFSGIIEEVGRVRSYDQQTLVIEASAVLDDLRVSESIMIAGACLTVIQRDDTTFTANTVPETVRRTSFGTLKAGDGVNLERSLKYGDRVGGHMVQGHVDGVGTVARVEPEGDSLRIWFDAPANIMRYVVEKGFIAVDGASLTVVDRDETRFSIAVIPFTRDHTTVGGREPGDPVNLEADVVSKYIERLAEPYLASRAGK